MVKHQPKYNEVFSIDNLYESAKKCYKGVGWKGTVQHYRNHQFTNIVRTYNEVMNHKFKSGQFFKFTIMERGKLRYIQSVGITERVVQRCFCDNLLVPLLSNKFIYDSAACIKEKGMHFAIKRMKMFLVAFYKQFKTNRGYILQYDFHHYFDTIPHGKLIQKLTKVIEDKENLQMVTKLINDFEGETGIGLGSQISQICALFYPNKIDHLFYRDGSLFSYIRYMDDGAMISNDKNKLKKCRDILQQLVDELDIELNLKKTTITKLSRGFVFLKARIKMLENGKIITISNSKNMKKNKRKLYIYREKLDKGLITFEEIKNIYKSTFAGMKFYDNYKQRKSYKDLFFKLFQKELNHDPERISLLKRHKFS